MLVNNGLEVLDEEECLQLLAQQSLGRLAVCIGALPAILPVNYRLVDRSILFATAAGTKLAAATNHTVVAFEVDSYDPFSHHGWSVNVTGVARLLPDRSPADARLRPWAPGDRHHLVEIPADLITGRRIRHDVAPG